MTTKTPEWLELAARRGSECRWTLGAILGEYCRIEGVTREQLASELGCSTDLLAWLSLCRRPAPERFANDMLKIAERLQVEGPKLVQIVRRVDAVAAIRGASNPAEDAESFVVAARDRDVEKDK